LKHFSLSICLLFFSSFFVYGVEPDEILLDTTLEGRARKISLELRCLVCRNENIDSSNAELARDLRIVVRERLVLGDTDDDVLNYVHARYGDFVLLRPKFSGWSILLWMIGPLSFLIGLLLLYLFMFRAKILDCKVEQVKDLSAAEQKKVDQFIEE
jgi:cytochrome c-type biogenesis protein CcmH